MKKSISQLNKALLLGAVMFSAILGLAGTNPPASKNRPAQNEKTLRDYLKFPQVLMPQMHDIKSPATQKVEVLFTTGKNGNVNFVLAKTPIPQLKEEIEKQFLGFSFRQLKADVVHSIVLSFKTI